MRRRDNPPDPAELPDVLQFMRVLWAVGHGLQRVSKRMEQQLGITGPQRLVIRVVGQFPGISAGALATMLHLHPSTLTGVLERLHRRRLIQRTPDPLDRRRTLLKLTARGAAIDRLRGGTAEDVVREALRGTKPGARAVAQALLIRVAGRLGETPGQSPPTKPAAVRRTRRRQRR